MRGGGERERAHQQTRRRSGRDRGNKQYDGSATKNKKGRRATPKKKRVATPTKKKEDRATPTQEREAWDTNKTWEVRDTNKVKGGATPTQKGERQQQKGARQKGRGAQQHKFRRGGRSNNKLGEGARTKNEECEGGSNNKYGEDKRSNNTGPSFRRTALSLDHLRWPPGLAQNEPREAQTHTLGESWP